MNGKLGTYKHLKVYGMKTTIEIDRELLETARKALNAETIKETVETIDWNRHVRKLRLIGIHS